MSPTPKYVSMECGCPIEKSATVCPRCFTPITRLQYDHTMCVSPLCTNESTDMWCDACIGGVISKCQRFCLFGATTTGLRRHVSLLGQIPISMRGLMHTNTWFSSEVMAAIVPRLCSGWEFRLEDDKIISTLDREAAEIEAAGNIVNLPADHNNPEIGKALRSFLLEHGPRYKINSVGFASFRGKTALDIHDQATLVAAVERARFQGCRIRDIVAEYEQAIHDIAECEEAGQIVTVAGVAFSANLL